MNFKKTEGLVGIILLILTISCNAPLAPDAAEPVVPVYAENVIVVEGRISQTSTWIAGKVYYVADAVYVDTGAVLTLEAGTIVKFGTTGRLSVESGSTITAIGNTSSPIIFTSIHDDSAGGNSVLNNGNIAPAPGDWEYVWIGDGSVSNTLSYCVFRYGGRNKEAAVYLDGVASVTNSRFYSNQCGMPSAAGEGAALDARMAKDGTIITDNLFYQNRWPLAIPVWMNLGTTNSFSFDHDNDNSTAALVNTSQAIYVHNGDIHTSTIWNETEVPFCIFDWIDIYDTGTLTTADSVVCKFAGVSAGLTFNVGSSYTFNNAVFTSFRDDSQKGDTNADGSASSPGNGDWYGILDEDLVDYLERNNVSGAIRYSEYTLGDY